jgi:hypothetical protein
MSEIVCTLDDSEFHRRRTDLLPGLLARSSSAEPLADGMRWRFEPGDGLLAQIAAVVDAERRCCRFLRFDLTVEPDLGPIWLSATGPAGTREFLSSLGEGSQERDTS